MLRLIALGHTNGEIAGQLYLSVRTVETHRSHIQQKLRLSNRAELVGGRAGTPLPGCRGGLARHQAAYRRRGLSSRRGRAREVTRLLSANRGKLDALALALLDRETLDQDRPTPWPGPSLPMPAPLPPHYPGSRR